MNYKCISVFLCALGFVAKAQNLHPLFKKGDRVCFVGNSITHNGEFHHNILQYYVTRFPKQPVSFFNAGVKGDVTGGVLERIESDVMIHKPTHVVIMIGMNDVQRHLYGSNVSVNPDTLTKRKTALDLYRKNLDSIVRIFLAKKVKVILQKPSAYDQTSKIKYPNNLGVNDALIECGQMMLALADKHKLTIVDYNTIMTNVVFGMQAKNPSATLTVNDRVHPNSTGHFIMAYEFLRSTKSSNLISKIVLDVNKLFNKNGNKNCVVETPSFTNKVLQFSVIENALPFPVTSSQQQAQALVPFNQEFNNQILQVAGLEKGNYQVQIDDILIDKFLSDSLQKGINLALYKQTPQYQQAEKVRKALELLWENEATYRAVTFVDYMCLPANTFENDAIAPKKYLDSLLVNKFNGQAYYKNAFEKYVAYKPKMNQLLQQADSLRNEVYKQAQPTTHIFAIKKIEEPTVAALIEASQSGAMPLLFNVQEKYLVKEVADFVSDKEFTVRNGLPNFFNKINQPNANVLIGFLGGSITKAEDMYRNQTLAFLQTINPSAKLKGINAGVSGTGTELGSCRIGEQILKYNPDLVFVEFAVNGGSSEAMEGIVRQIIKQNPQTDICFIYTIAGEQYKQYAKDEVPAKITAFDNVAAYYNLPSIHMGLYASTLAAQEKLIWKSGAEVEGKIVFSKDGTHPAKAGGDLYAQAITRAFNNFKSLTTKTNHALIQPMYPDNWENATMYEPKENFKFSDGWENLNSASVNQLKAFAPWFATVATTSKPNASVRFKFKGTVFGFFDIGGPEAGQVLVEIDGKCAELARKAGNASNKLANAIDIKCLNNRFNTNCNNRYRGQFEMFEVPDGEHEVKISLSPMQANKLAILEGQDLTDIQQNPEKYKQQVFYLGRILVKGTVVDK